MPTSDPRRVVLAVVDGTDSRMGTVQCTKLFGVPMGYHPIINAIRGSEEALSSITDLRVYLDVPATTDISNNATRILTLTPATGSLTGWSASRKQFSIRADASDTYQAVDHGGPYHLWDSLSFRKADTATWFVEFDYRLVPGAMIWLDEWAELLKDKTNVTAHLRNPGDNYHRVGDYYQINKRRHILN